MADIQDFEKTLKEVVNAKRLSTTKMSTLTEQCMKSIEHDTQLVSLLYRTHKSLPTGQKVSSLYVFDALARAARHAVNKHNITVDPMGTKGNCATFLNKVEGVLDSLVDDMLSSGQKELRVSLRSFDHYADFIIRPLVWASWSIARGGRLRAAGHSGRTRPDRQEKTKKILDIWTTNNTFSKETLAGLSAKVKTAEDKAAALAAAVPQTATPPTAPPPNLIQSLSPPANAAQAAGVQQALLALLSQAAAAKGATPPTNTAPLAQVPPPAAPTSITGLGIDAQRLLQQLAGQVQNQTQPIIPLGIPLITPAVPAAPSPPPKPMPIYAPNLPPPPDQMAAQRALAATQMSPSTDNNRADNLPSGSRPSRWGHVRERSPPPPGDGRDDFRRDDHRDDYRGRGRGRGRGPSDRGGPDRGVPDRGGSDRRGGRGGNRSPPPYGGRERSRSPPYRGPGGNRFNNRGPPGDERFPPRRESPVRNRSPPRYRSPPGRDAGLMAQSMARTDEFGREARGNDERIPPKASEGAEPRTELNTFQKSNTTSTSSAPPSSVAAPIPALPIAPKKGGLDAFDWTTFNFASPQSWDALGRAFQVTNGHLPSETEAMSLVMQQQMGGMMGGMMGQTVMGGQPSGSAARANGAFNNSGQSQPGWQNGGQNQSHQDSQRGARGRGRGRGSGRGGGFGYGRGGSGSDAGYAAQQNQQGSFASNQDSGWGNGGGQGWGASETQSWEVGNTNGTVVSDPPSAPSAPTSQAGDGESPISKKHGGQMVKIGDRWQWVPA